METVLYDPLIDADIFARGFLEFGQVPVSPLYPSPPSLSATDIFTPLPSLLDNASANPSGVTLNTNGNIFNGIPGYDPFAYFISNGNILSPTGRSLQANANTGYAGFTNYTVDFENIDINDIEGSLSFEPVNSSFPILDSATGFTIAFDLAILQEASAANRAGFSIVAVTSDPSKEIEIGFKTAGADRAFAQDTNFVEAENSSATSLDFSTPKTYWLSISGSTYSLAANGVEILSGLLRNYNFDPTTSNPPLPAAANPYATPNFLFWGDNTDQAHAQFTLGKISILPQQTALTETGYDDYIASHADLITALGYDLNAGKLHYLNFGFQEDRLLDDFAEDRYLAAYGDLITAFGYNLEAATRHFIEHGFTEGRSPERFIPELYLAAYEDLQSAFGDDLTAATQHYIQYGYAEGRDSFADFGAVAYIASYGDLITAFGYDPEAGLNHYLQNGIEEGREISFAADDYIASYGDLITGLGYDLAAGIEHFIRYGSSEGRDRDTFDEVAYLNNYPDLQSTFGSNLEAATQHYIQFGYAEGRTV